MQRAIDFSQPGDLSGYRLHRFEVLNWGTFHKHIWTLPPDGENSLLTGDIGSGKSTLVDGLTTLLVRPQKIVYNKAAGADTRERSLRSYVRGYYKSAKDSDTLAAKSIALRDHNSFSVLLAWFYNHGYRQSVTLAQVFWSRDHANPPERFYVAAKKSLTISKDFSDFGADTLALKKRLRKQKDITVFDSFAQYAVALRRQLGIESTQALDLFYQTVSMKSVGNLTDFVRRHMLEEPPVQTRIEKNCRQFDDLNHAHEAVLKARRQVEALSPIVADAERFRRLSDGIADLTLQREALYAFFAKQKITLLDRRLANRTAAFEKLGARITTCRLRLDHTRTEQRRLDRAISDSGGKRLEELSEQIERLTAERHRISEKANVYRGYCRKVKLPFPAQENAFVDNRRLAARWKEQAAQKRDDIVNQQVEQKVRLKEVGAQIEALESELASLKGRKTNIPRKNLSIRRNLSAALDVPENALPFAGELIRVKTEAAAWEGAIERLLHNFGLSLLVPEHLYAKVARHVDSTHLAGRLVYFKTDAVKDGRVDPPGPDALRRNLDIKPDTSFYGWLDRQLTTRFNHVCCETTQAFRRRKTAITAAGQIKSGGVRHEKDDRHRIDDRSRYILGWHNQDKIRVLQTRLAEMQGHWDAGVADLQKLDDRRKNADAARELLHSILTFETFAEIHWQPVAQQVQKLAEEKQQIEQSSDVLHTLQKQLEQVLSDIGRQEEKLGRMQARSGQLQEGVAQDNRLRQAALSVLGALAESLQKSQFPLLAAMQPEALGDKKITIENCDPAQTRMREWLQQRIDGQIEKTQRLSARIIRGMQAYKGLYPLETKEVDAAMGAVDEFAAMFSKLKKEDLPRHEQRFKKKLNEETIQGMALFQAKLDSELQDIRDKIHRINHSLSAIDYSDGTYITLVADPSKDAEIRQFREDLRACLGDTLTGSDEDTYTEHKFLQVKAIIDRFNGRQGQTELDRRWTHKVTDVRNWLLFSVSEKWREDDKEREFYSDTSGKSGGQKEKLAYTILASALVYQFGLKFGETRSHAFRFVMIDEAFGRGSDESTRYALELFNKLNLQLLIVTPLQKIHIIEDYVQSVNYIHNEDGKNSMVRNLTIEQYRQEKAAFQESAA